MIVDDKSADPPLLTAYKNLRMNGDVHMKFPDISSSVEECELPLIDLNMLNIRADSCKKEISQASKEFGFFQVINHGISQEILEAMRCEQFKLFKKPFCEKKNYKDMNFSQGSYRWGTPSAKCINQLSWSEAFHVSLSDVLDSRHLDHTTSSTMEKVAIAVSKLALKLADILVEEAGRKPGFIKKACLPNTCYLRLNRYPPCPIYPRLYGIVPHTDSDFLTVLHQDSIGGLQLVKDGKWIAVKPNRNALIINIGDLFQAWSNNIYKSVEHRVVANGVEERFSTAYFLCPSLDTVIDGTNEGGVYRSFSFGEYKKQIQEDVQILGHKVGLHRFLVPSY